MKKRIISFLLAVLLIFSMTLTVSAESTTVTANYYQVPMMTTYSDYSQAELLVDMMVYPTRNEIYIKAEDLCDLAPGYKFSLSTDNCAFDSDERGHVVYYSFNAKKMLVYYDQNPVSYKMPYTAKYVDEVAWIPLDFGMKMLNIKYTIDADGAVCCVPYETVFSIAHRIRSGEFDFDYASDLGYSDLSMFGMQTGAFLATLFNGLIHMEGSCWGTLITGLWGNSDLYDGMIAEGVCDLFVTASEDEVAKAVTGLYKIPLNGSKIVGVVQDAQKAGDQAQHIENLATVIVNERIATNSKLSRNVDEVAASLKEITGKKGLSALGDKFSMGKMDILGCLLDLAAMKLQFENRDKVAAAALKYYAKESGLNVASTVRSYANHANYKSDTAGAFARYCKENWDNIILGAINMGAGGLMVVLWDVVSLIPGIKDRFDSIDNFSYAIQATDMQNDARLILESDYTDVFSKKSLDEESLENLALDCYVYLKFSLVARECAAKSIEKSSGIETDVRDSVVNSLRKKNDNLYTALATVSCVEEGSSRSVNNDNGAYGLLIPSENSEYNRKLDDKPVIEAVEGGLGTLIASTSQETEPEKNVVITEEQAIQIVKDALDKYSMGLMSSPQFEGIYSYECVELADAYSVDLDKITEITDVSQFDAEYCYIIAHYTGESPDAIFCVAADGTGAYICSGMDGEYAYMPEFDLNDLSIWDVAEVIKQLYGLLFEEALKTYAQQG